MCLAIPAKVMSLDGSTAKVDILGNELTVAIHLVPEVSVGQHVLVHAGFAVEIVDEEIARETLEIFMEEADERNQWS